MPEPGAIVARWAHPLVAAAVVFGAPCACSVVGAVRGRLPIGRHLYAADGSPMSVLAIWGVAAALAAGWAGVSLHLGLAPGLAPRQRDAWAAGLILGGTALLFLSGHLLGSMLLA